jgi:CheY-like chemotaxis protein
MPPTLKEKAITAPKRQLRVGNPNRRVKVWREMARILLIDDDKALREVLRLSLEHLGHAVMEAQDGDEGLALYAKHGADIVLTDLIMPGREGLETIQELRRLYPSIKIIAMSGGGRVAAQDYLKVAAEFGAVRMLAKPFAIPVLAEAITATLAETGLPPR